MDPESRESRTEPAMAGWEPAEVLVSIQGTQSHSLSRYFSTLADSSAWKFQTQMLHVTYIDTLNTAILFSALVKVENEQNDHFASKRTFQGPNPPLAMDYDGRKA